MSFQKSEYIDRLNKTKISMQEKGIDTLIASDPANMYYLSGFNAWSFYMPQCLVINLNLDEPLCFVRAQDAGGAFLQLCWSHKNIIVYPEKYIHTPPAHPYEYLSDKIKERKMDSGTIGLEMDSHYFTATCYLKLKENLPNAKFVDSDFLVNWIRFIKSDHEIQFMQKAARNVEIGMKTAINTIGTHLRQCDLAAEIYRSLIKGSEENGGDYSSIAPLMPTGKGTSAAHLTWTDKNFETNEATIIELAGVYQRYHCPMARTVFLGKKNQEKVDMMNKTIEALEEGMFVIKSGITAGEIAVKFWAVLDKYKIKKESRTGYSIGVGYPPDWGERTMNIQKNDPTILKSNCTFHMIAVIQMGDWGVEVSHSIRVTDGGFKKFSNYPTEIIFKD